MVIILVKIKIKKNKLEIVSKKKKNYFAKYELVKKIRTGILVIGPLLAKFNNAKVSLTGGCAIGARPVDLHLDFLSLLGTAGLQPSLLLNLIKSVGFSRSPEDLLF